MTTTLWAAPRGARVGFTAASDGSHQVVITVLPKPWRPDNRKIVVAVQKSDSAHHAIALYESDRLHLPNASAVTQELLTRLLRAARSEDPQDSPLLVPDVAPTEADLRTARAIDPGNNELVGDLLLLFDHLNVLLPKSEDLLATPAYSPLHRPLLCRRLLDEVFALAHSARRGYRSVVAAGATIRGRIVPASLTAHQLTGNPQLLFQYDELTESTILLSVVVAALQRIADAVDLRSPFTGKYSVTELRHDAVRLRRVFAEVTALPPAQARQAGRRLRLSRLDQPWSRALALSLVLLDQDDFGTMFAHQRMAEAVELSIPTDKLWERIVTQALQRAGFTNVMNQATQPAGATADPWLTATGEGSRTRPDNLALHGNQLWVVDAKYKLHGDLPWPQRDDQYQMFAYSHLVEHDGRVPSHVALIYPGRGEPRIWRRGRSPADFPCTLHALQIPFPEPGTVRNPADWETYLDSVGAALRP
jgi:5-methylcytosine-specific restriction endonuclease McrBC regulatory subunit McrC